MRQVIEQIRAPMSDTTFYRLTVASYDNCQRHKLRVISCVTTWYFCLWSFHNLFQHGWESTVIFFSTQRLITESLGLRTELQGRIWWKWSHKAISL